MMRKENEVLEQLRAAESLIGTPTTEMFMDQFPEHRLKWLRETRALLELNGIEPETTRLYVNCKRSWSAQ